MRKKIETPDIMFSILRFTAGHLTFLLDIMKVSRFGKEGDYLEQSVQSFVPIMWTLVVK